MNIALRLYLSIFVRSNEGILQIYIVVGIHYIGLYRFLINVLINEHGLLWFKFILRDALWYRESFFLMIFIGLLILIGWVFASQTLFQLMLNFIIFFKTFLFFLKSSLWKITTILDCFDWAQHIGRVSRTHSLFKLRFYRLIFLSGLLHIWWCSSPLTFPKLRFTFNLIFFNVLITYRA